VVRDRVGHDAPRSLRRHLLLAAQDVLYWSGAAAIYSCAQRSAAPVILMYHSVPCEDDAAWIAPRNRMHPSRFERQMRFLSRHRRVVAIDELRDALERGDPIPPRTVLLTFDDGYRDNLEVVAPILQEYRLPAALYLATGYVTDGENQWADQLYVAIRRRRRDHLDLDGVGQFDLGRPEAREAAYRAIAQRLLVADRPSREQTLRRISEQLMLDSRSIRQTLTWEEVRRLADQNPLLTLGVHTADHLDLSSVTVNDAMRQIRRSVVEFETRLGRLPRHFSFPYSRSVQEICRRLPELGISTAMTGTETSDAAQPDPLDLRRIEAPVSLTRLRYVTSGAHPRLSQNLLGRA